MKAQWEELEEWKKLLIVILLSLGIAYLIYMFILSPKMEELDKLKKEREQLNNELTMIKRNATEEKRRELEKKLTDIRKENAVLKAKLEEVKEKFKPRDNIQNTLVFISNVVKKNRLILDSFTVNSIDDLHLRYNPETDKIEYITKSSKKVGTLEEAGSLISKVKTRLKPSSPKERKKKEAKRNEKKVGGVEKVPLENTVHLKRISVSLRLHGTTKELISFLKDINRTKNYIRIESVELVKTGSKGGGFLRIYINLSAFYMPEKEQN